MAEQPDTAAIRALISPQAMDGDTVIWLCDALDVARAMRDTHACDVTDLANKHARALDRAEAAEARIAAALDVCREAKDRSVHEQGLYVARIWGALTGGEQ